MSTDLFYILDRGLARKIGHHYTYCKSITNELLRRGINFVVYGHNVTSGITDIPNFVPAFEDYAYGPVDISTVQDISIRFATVVFNIINHSKQSNIFIPNATFIEVSAVFFILQSLPKIDTQFQIVLRTNASQTLSDGTRIGELCLSQLGALSNSSNVTLFADSSDACIYWAENNIRVLQIPFPTDKIVDDSEKLEAVINNRIPPFFLSIGQGGKHKGLDKILAALQQISSEGYPVHGAVHHTFFNIEDSVLKSLPNVEFISQELGINDYNNLISRATHIFSFYDSAVYAIGTSSNILIETLVNRRIPIVSPFRHAFEMLGCDYNLYGSKDWSASSLVDLLRRSFNSPCDLDALERIWRRAETVSGAKHVIDALLNN